jgi:hypothetical protein
MLKSFITLADGSKHIYHGNFNPRKSSVKITMVSFIVQNQTLQDYVRS